MSYIKVPNVHGGLAEPDPAVTRDRSDVRLGAVISAEFVHAGENGENGGWRDTTTGPNRRASQVRVEHRTRIAMTAPVWEMIEIIDAFRRTARRPTPDRDTGG